MLKSLWTTTKIPAMLKLYLRFDYQLSTLMIFSVKYNNRQLQVCSIVSHINSPSENDLRRSQSGKLSMTMLSSVFVGCTYVFSFSTPPAIFKAIIVRIASQIQQLQMRRSQLSRARRVTFYSLEYLVMHLQQVPVVCRERKLSRGVLRCCYFSFPFRPVFFLSILFCF